MPGGSAYFYVPVGCLWLDLLCAACGIKFDIAEREKPVIASKIIYGVINGTQNKNN